MAKEVNHVRQVLMNELGLTRETIRGEMLSIIETTIQRAFNDGKFDGTIERLVAREADKIVKGSDRWSQDNLKTMVAAAVKSEIGKQVRESIIVNLALKNAEQQEPA